MVTSIRPQDDLYRYVNGTWLEETEIPSDKASWGAFMQLHEASQDAVRDIITSLPQGAEAGTPQQQIADLYASYMDTEKLESLGTTPLQPLLAKVDEVHDIAGLMALMGWMHRHDLGSLIGIGSDADPFQPSRYLLFVSQSGLGLPDEAYYRLDEHAQIRTEYVAHMGRLLALAGVSGAEAKAQQVMALETEIAAQHWDNVRCRDMVASMNARTLEQFRADYPGLLFDEFLAGAEWDPAKFAELIVAQLSFFEGVQPLLVSERLDDWRAWAVWHITSALAMSLTEAMEIERFSFVGTTLSGTPQLEDRWRRGVNRVEGALGEPVGRLYVDLHFPVEAKQRMDELVGWLLKAYERSIMDLDWMTDQTKKEALHKLAKFTPKIGYPNSWRDYSALEISSDDLIGNRLRASEFHQDYDINRAMGDMNPDEWLMSPQTVNAYYHPLRNEIVFPAAILQPPFFDLNATAAANYGGIGAVIGHEIGHGFDDQGATCDGDGALRDWWTQADKEAFKDRTHALIEQFDALYPQEVPDQHVNGSLTIGENIGDLGGVSIAFKAWQLANGRNDVDEVTDIAGTQEFFQQYATIWQTKRRPELAAQLLAIDPHSPGEFRCNQIVKNVDAFYAAFDVQPTDQLWLDSDKRVRIW